MVTGIVHKRVVKLRDTGQPDDWNNSHEITGNVEQGKFQFLNAVIENRTDFPAGPVVGQKIYRTDFKNAMIWNGTIWRALAPAFLVVVAGDGSGDYTDIQDGLDSIGHDGGIVHIKTNTYTITQAITFPNDSTVLEGDGIGTVITTTTADISLIEVAENDRITLRNLYLYGDGLVKNNAGIEWISSHEGRIENVYIQNCGGMGIYMEDAEGCFVAKNIIRDCWNWGMLLVDVHINSFQDNFIWDITEDDDGSGILIMDSDRNMFNNNQIIQCAWDGIYILTCTYNNFEGNMVLNNSHGNVNVFNGITLDGTSTHNSIVGNKSFDDQIVHTQATGIEELGIADNYNIITNNTCTGNITAEITSLGPNSIEDNNMTLP